MQIYSIAIKNVFPKIMAVCLLKLLELQKSKLLYVNNQRLNREDIAILLYKIPLYHCRCFMAVQQTFYVLILALLYNGSISISISPKSLQPVQLVYFNLNQCSLTVCTTSVTLSVIQSFINLIVWSICCCWRWNPTGWLWGLPFCCHHDAP